MVSTLKAFAMPGALHFEPTLVAAATPRTLTTRCDIVTIH